jgi:putative nucleotidyltransferase with HDIG domain
MDLDDEERRRRNGIIRTWLQELETDLPGETAHSEHVAVYALAIASELETQVDLLPIRYAAELHDIGKIRARWPAKDHPVVGSDLMAAHAFLADSRGMVRHHHEWWNGCGYPDGLAGTAIPIGARMIAVAEAFDAMTLPWGWRERLPEQEALDELLNQAGRQFDPMVVRAFLKVQPIIQPIGL